MKCLYWFFHYRKRRKERLYLQQQLTDNVGPAIYADFGPFYTGFVTPVEALAQSL